MLGSGRNSTGAEPWSTGAESWLSADWESSFGTCSVVRASPRMIFMEENRLTFFFFLGLGLGSGGSARTIIAVEDEPSVAGSGTAAPGWMTSGSGMAATGWMSCGSGEALISPILRSARLIVCCSAGAALEMY